MILTRAMLWGAGAAIVALGVLAGVGWYRAGSWEDRALLAEANLEVAATVNSQQSVTITSTVERLNACVEERETDEAANSATLQALAGQVGSIQERIRQLKADRDAAWSTPGCVELGDMDLAAVCPAVANRLRQAASGAAGADRSAGPRTDAHAQGLFRRLAVPAPVEVRAAADP